eukprot:s4946_g2.t1
MKNWHEEDKRQIRISVNFACTKALAFKFKELSTGLLTPALLPLLGGFRHLHSLCLPVECRGPDSYVTAWEAVAKCPSLRALSLFAQGKAMKVEGEKLERISTAVRSMELESLQVNVTALQGWRGLSSRGFSRILAAMAGSQLKRLQISWLRSPGTHVFAMLAGFIEAAVCLRQMVLDIPPGQDWSVDPDAFHLEEVALRRDVSILWPKRNLEAISAKKLGPTRCGSW